MGRRRTRPIAQFKYAVSEGQFQRSNTNIPSLRGYFRKQIYQCVKKSNTVMNITLNTNLEPTVTGHHGTMGGPAIEQDISLWFSH